jgi:hypothetical protein
MFLSLARAMTAMMLIEVNADSDAAPNRCATRGLLCLEYPLTNEL